MNDNLNTLVGKWNKFSCGKLMGEVVFEREMFCSLIEVRDKFAQSAQAVIYSTHPHLPAIHVCLTSLDLPKIARMSGGNVLEAKFIPVSQTLGLHRYVHIHVSIYSLLKTYQLPVKNQLINCLPYFSFIVAFTLIKILDIPWPYLLNFHSYPLSPLLVFLFQTPPFSSTELFF